MAKALACSRDPGFWQDKTPCWEMCHCPESIKESCPAPKYTEYPCWEIEGTYLKLADNGERGDDTSICQICRVFKRYGDGRWIQLRLFGKGIDAYLRNLKRQTELLADKPTGQHDSQPVRRPGPGCQVNPSNS